MPAPSRNKNSRSAFSKNKGNKQTSGKNHDNNKVKFSSDSVKHAKKSRKSKGQKSAQSKKFSKFKKSIYTILPKNRYLSNFDTTEAEPSILTLNAKIAFNYL